MNNTRSIPVRSRRLSNTQRQPPKPPKPILPLYSWRGISSHTNLLYIRNCTEADLEVSKLGGGTLGFDLEWRPTFVKGHPENPVALVQLANEDTILLIQISAMSKFPPMLRAVLEDRNIVKVGVGIQNDCKKLYNDYGVNVRNCCDLSLLARSADNDRWKGRYKDPIGLARLVEAYEELTVPKGKVQRSNWELQLTVEQQEYAANDAHSAFLMYARLSKMANSMATIPDPDCYSFDYVSGRICDPSGMLWHPANPHYDPGPPPPPRPSAKAKDSPENPAAITSTSSVTASLTAGPSQRPLVSPPKASAQSRTAPDQPPRRRAPRRQRGPRVARATERPKPA